jgi:hypothetical protein
MVLLKIPNNHLFGKEKDPSDVYNVLMKSEVFLWLRGKWTQECSGVLPQTWTSSKKKLRHSLLSPAASLARDCIPM